MFKNPKEKESALVGTPNHPSTPTTTIFQAAYG